MIFLVKIVIILYIFSVILQYKNFCISIFYIKKQQKKIKEIVLDNKKRTIIHIIIPILDEISLITDCVKNFSSLEGEYTLTFVTTDKEKIFSIDNINKTKEILESLKNKYRFNIINYPFTKGVMAHQLNYAVSKMEKTGSIVSGDYIVIYNVDSFVHKKLITDIQKFLYIHNYPNIIHQPAVFVRNYVELKNYFLKNIALLQSTWTLTDEIPRILRSSSNNKFIKLFESGHVVGHGLIIKPQFLNDIGGFPTNFRNEDLPLGYKISNKGEKIKIFPILENADSPVSIKQVIRQYTTWYYGASGYIKYFLNYKKEIKKFEVRAFITAIHNQIRSIVWLMSAIFIVTLFILFFQLNIWFFYLLIILFFIKHPLQQFLSLFFINNLAKKQDNIKYKKNKYSIHQSYLNIFSYIIHTFGPIRAAYQIIITAITGKIYEKEKTQK